MIKICADRREVGGGRRAGGAPRRKSKGSGCRVGRGLGLEGPSDVSVDPEHICFQLACFC